MTASAFGQLSFVNQGGQVTINDNGPASPYPSTNKVDTTPLSGVLEKLTVTLNSVTHGYPDDIDIILEGPDGTRTTLVSDAGGQFDLGNVTFTLDSTASGSLPNDTAIADGSSYKPANYDGGDPDQFAAGGNLTAGSYSGLAGDLSLFTGKTPNLLNGTWNLYVADDTVVDAGSIRNWALNFYFSPVVLITNASPVAVTEDTPTTINVFVNDADSPLSGLTLTADSSDTAIIANSGLSFGGNTGGTNRTLTITPVANASGGPITITITAKDAQGNVFVGVNRQTITVNVAPANDAPSLLLATTSTSIPQGGVSTNIALRVIDVDAPAAANDAVLTAISSNPSVIPATNVLFSRIADVGGLGTNRVVQIAAGSTVGSAVITIVATDAFGATNTTAINVNVTAVAQLVASNPAAINAPDTATTASSTITITTAANLGLVGRARVSLINVEHPNPKDLDILLVSPSGASVLLSRGAGGNASIGVGDTNDVRITFDTTGTSVPTPIVTGTYLPTDIIGSGSLLPPAPAAPYGTSMNALVGSPVAGNWKLYVFDEASGNGFAGKIAGGWVLEIFPAPVITAIGTQTTTEDKSISVPFTVTDFDGVVTNVVATSSNTGIVPNPANSVGNVNGLTSGSFTFNPVANANGSVTITLVATDNGNFTSTNTFTLNVTPVNDAPTQSVIAKQIARAGQSVGPVTFSVGDLESDPANLVVTATSDNPKLLPQGAIILGGSAANRTITIFPAGAQAGQANITVTVTDDGTGSPSSAAASSTQLFNLTVNEAASPLYENTTGIQVLDAPSVNTVGLASPYPSTINVSGLQGTIAEVQVTLFGITHPKSDDLDVMLVGPGASPTSVLLMADAGGPNPLNNTTIRFRQSASSLLPSTQIPSGDYRPTTYEGDFAFPQGGSPTPGSINLDSYIGANANGDWKLYVIDDQNGPRGGIISSWQLSIRTKPALAAIANQTTLEDTPLRVTISLGDNQPGVTNTLSVATNAVGSSTAVIAQILTGGGQNLLTAPQSVVGSSQTLTFNLIPDASGTNQVTLTLTDINGNASVQSFNLIVTPVNDAPRFSTIANASTPAGTPLGISFTANDPEGKAVTVVATSSVQGVVADTGLGLSGPDGSGNRSLAITPFGVASGQTTITLTATDADGQKSTASFVLTVTPSVAFVNANPITINDNALANPYPSTIDVSGVQGTVSGASVTLVGFTHPFPDDVDVLLVAPDGRSVMLMSDAGGGTPANGLRLSFSDSSATPVPDETALQFAVYRPANYTQIGEVNEMPAPAPAAPNGGYSTSLSSLAGVSPNGQWKLYVRDDLFPDGGAINGGWILSLQTAPIIAQIPNQTISEDALLPLRFTVSDQDTPVTGLTISYSVVSVSTNFNDPGLLTASTFTLVTNSVNFPDVSYTLNILPATNRAGTNSVTITVEDGPTGAPGTRSDQTTFLVTVVPVDDPPAITGAFVPSATFSYATNHVVTGEDTPLTLQFQVSDIDSTLGTSNVVVQSSNPLLVPNNTTNIAIPAVNNQSGPFTVSVTILPTTNQNSTVAQTTTLSFIVSDRTQSVTNQVVFEVTPSNDLPILAVPSITSQSPTIPVVVGNSVSVPFTVNDTETAPQDLVLTVVSSTQSIIPNANLVISGRGADRTLTITTIGSVSSDTQVNVTLVATDVSGGSASFVIPVIVSRPPGQVVSSVGVISIPAGTATSGSASPYPSVINVGLVGTVSKIIVSIDGLTHTAPDDIDMLLVGPTGKKVILMSDAGGRNPISNVNIDFDVVGRALPDESPITSGTFQPTDYEVGDVFPSPAPAGPYATSLTEFIGTDPFGNWSLYIVDDASGDAGRIANSWSLRIETAPAITLNSGLNAGNNSFLQLAEDNTATVQLTVSDPSTAAKNIAVSFTSSDASLIGSVTTNWVNDAGSSLTFDAVIRPATNAFGTNNITVVARRSDGAQFTKVIPVSITPANDAPVISRLTDRTIPADTSLSLPLAITDYDTPLSRLLVTVTSGNQNVITNTHLLLGNRANVLTGIVANASSSAAFPRGAADTWTNFIAITPNAAAFSGTPVPITVSVQELDVNGNINGLSAVSTFNVTVTPVNHAPVVGVLPAIIPLEAGKSTTNIVFTVSDPDNDSPLVITATSSDPTLARDQDIIIDVPSGPPGSRQVRVATQPGVTGDVTITLRVTDPAGARGAGTFVVRLTPTRERVFANRTPITLRDNNSADPYPSQIPVSGFNGNISRVTVTLNGFWHTFPDDADLLLVSPGGQKVILMSDAGGGTGIPSSSALTIKFDDTDSAAVAVPDNTGLQSRTYRVANYEATTTDDFVNRTPAGPAGPYAEVLSAFNGVSPNGTWSLYALDDTPSDSGAITNGWSLGITTLPGLVGLTDVVSQEDIPVRIPFTISEETFADTASYSFAVSSSNPALVPGNITNIVITGSGTNRTVQVIPTLNANTNNTGTNALITLVEQTTGVSGSFRVTFVPVNDAPQIPAVADQTIPAGSFLTINNFNYSDVETAKKDLRVLPIESTDPAVIPPANVTISGTDLRIFAGTTTGKSQITLRIADLGDGINAPVTNSISFNVTVSAALNTVASSTAPITISDNARANPYPSTVEITGVRGTTRTVTLTLIGLTHPFPDDVDILLVGPNGQGVVVTSDAGAGGNSQTALNNVSLLFSDAATDSVPDNGAITPFGIYKPTNYEVSNSEFLAPAPAGPYATTFTAAFADSNPNGTWSLYVQDDASPDAGSLAGWTLNVALNEVGPTITGLTDTNVLEDAFVQIPFTVASSNLNDVTFITSSSNSNLVSSIKVGGSGADRVLQITLVPNASGTNTVTLQATDATGTRTRQFVLTVTPVNDLPVFGPVANQRISGPANVTLDITDIDTPANQLVFTASTAGVGLIADVQFTATGSNVIARITPATGAQGTETLTVTVSDGSGGVSRMFNVTIGPAGPPVIGTIPNVVTSANTPATVTFTVTDSDTSLSELIFFASAESGNIVSDVSFATVSDDTVALTIIPIANRFGTERVTVSVSDGTATVSTNFLFTVSTPGPVIGEIADQTTPEDTTLTIPILVSDPDTAASQLVIFASTSNTNLVRDVTFITQGTNTTATITLVTNAFGTADIAVRASDGNTSFTRTFRLTVTEVCEPPVIATIPAQNASGSTLVVPISVTDPDDVVSKLTFSAAAAGNSVVSDVTFAATATGANATFTLFSNATGSEQVTIQVSDGCQTARQTFTLTVGGSGSGAVAIGVTGTNLVLTVNGAPGTTVVIEGSTDLVTWRVVSAVIIGPGGSAQVTLPKPGRNQYFRTRIGSAPAQAPAAYEAFDYTPGSAIATDTAGGTGFAGAWTPDAEGPATNHVVLASSLQYVDAFGNSLKTSGGSAFFTGTNVNGGDIRAFRTFSTPLTSGTTWISFLGVRSGPTGGTTANPYPRAANLSFYLGDTEKFAIGNVSGAPSNLWSVVPAGSLANVTNAQRSGTSFSQLALIVIRVDHKGGNADDLYMWVNPSLGSVPNVASASARSTGSFDFSFDRVRPFVGGLDAGNNRLPAELTIDELRVGTTFASVVPYSVRPDVTFAGYPTVVVNGTDTGGGPIPASEGVEHTIDNAGQKYLNFTKRGSGFVVTTPSPTLVTGLRLWTANDAVERDPASYKLEGSTAGASGPFTTISEGNLNLPAGRNAGGLTVPLVGGYFQELSFANTAQYTAYRVTFPTVKNASANSMQIAEVELLGPVIP